MHATHLFSAAKAEADLRGKLARHTRVHGSLAQELSELEQWHSGFKAAVKRRVNRGEAHGARAQATVHTAQARPLGPAR
jgi:hypothetical protein